MQVQQPPTTASHMADWDSWAISAMFSMLLNAFQCFSMCFQRAIEVIGKNCV